MRKNYGPQELNHCTTHSDNPRVLTGQDKVGTEIISDNLNNVGFFSHLKINFCFNLLIATARKENIKMATVKKQPV